MLICFWVSQELPEILLPTHNSSDFMSNTGAVLCVSTDRSSAHFYHCHLVKKAEKFNSQTFFLVQNNVKIPWRKWETRLSLWSFALRCSLFEIQVFKKHVAASLNNFSSNVWLFSPYLLGEKRTWAFLLLNGRKHPGFVSGSCPFLPEFPWMLPASPPNKTLPK